MVVRRFCKPQHGDGFMRAYCVVQRGTMYVCMRNAIGG